ncbi:unnamed protein product [Ectocarpus sp. CCAP 1310/34]|nr:unnamed protein product [Ectocarpus sp. CCAP 1310/34]
MHSQRTPRRDAVFHIKDGGMVEKQRLPLAMATSMSARTTAQPGGGGESTKEKAFCTTLRSHWVTSTQSMAPAFSPPETNEPTGTWYEQADRVFRFFGFIVDQVDPTSRQVYCCTLLRTSEIH